MTTPDEQHPTLSPADFLQLHTSLGVPSPPSDDKDPDFQPSTTRSTTAADLLNAWKKGQKLLNSFWATWKTAYLPSLRETHRARLTRPSATVPPPCIGDVIQEHDQISRSSWKLGRITDLTTSRDGQIRSAQVQLVNNNFINRPLSALYPLEFSSSSPPSDTHSSEATQPEQQPRRRSTRAAAHRANECLASASRYWKLYHYQYSSLWCSICISQHFFLFFRMGSVTETRHLSEPIAIIVHVQPSSLSFSLPPKFSTSRNFGNFFLNALK